MSITPAVDTGMSATVAVALCDVAAWDSAFVEWDTIEMSSDPMERIAPPRHSWMEIPYQKITENLCSEDV